MNAEQIAKLKEVALKAPKNPGEWPFYLRSFQAAASPDVILELIALAERAIVAESRVAEIQRGVEGLSNPFKDFGQSDKAFGWSQCYASMYTVLKLAKEKPTGCTHNCNQGRDCTCK